ncbi:hypothetical protein ACH5RR_025313 [Cinchona calisaya]|uniref:Uncharacterized protein n=1 Tax=Cinchona calisaya TaxID=153742 RepID=A0ABD2YZW2_9GENT
MNSHGENSEEIETTLLKLKEGSQRCQSLPLVDAISTDVSCITASDSPETIGADCASTDSSLNSSGEESTSMSFSMDKRDKTLSVLYLFSKYKKGPRNTPNSPNEEAMAVENVYSCVNTSPSVDNSQLISG